MTTLKCGTQCAYGYKSLSILINIEKFPSTRLFLFNRSQLNKYLAWRRLEERETWKIEFYKVLTPELFFYMNCRNGKKKKQEL